MHYFLSERESMVKDLSARLAGEVLAPLAQSLDEDEEFSWEAIRALARSDLFRVWVPEEYGGLGGGVFEQCLVVEELSRVESGVAVSYAASGLGALPILLAGSEEQKTRYLPCVAAGEKLAAFALTEPEAGSDASAIRARAMREDDSYVLSGTKQYITNGGVADIYTVIMLTDPSKGTRGASAFVVEKGTEGFSFGKKEKKMGIRASATCSLIFDNCRVPRTNLLGREGLGFPIAMKTLDRSRPGIGAQAVGVAQGALDFAVKYAREREQFRQPISSFQAIAHMLADMATQIEAARALVYAAARMIDAGIHDFSKESAMAKLFASEMAMKVTTDAVQILGGAGYMRDYPVEKMMRDAKITQIYEGTNQIQREVISRELVKKGGRAAGVTT
ncbi:MAG: acyl-CoA dehydrogenase family protein [Firmicutes bacterium]|nr:acyl-CoA dehydrogenase family protein [Bacillota bacterium]